MLVIGGGIHGVGAAQAAAAAGHHVILLEQEGLAHGTSSRSSKLIHGGLRYLESGEFSLVKESLHERELLLKLAPDIVKRRKFFIPIYHQTSRRPWSVRAGLGLYALLAGMGEYARFHTVPRNEWQGLDGLATEGLRAVFQYWDAQTDDVLLTRSVMASAQQLGAQLICPARFLSAQIESQGCLVSYQSGGADKECRCSVVVNAAGPWARTVARKFNPGVPDLAVDNIQGTHLVLTGQLTKGCYYLEVPRDQRAVFAMPWKNNTTLLGTTEHDYEGDPGEVVPLPEEKQYLLDVYQHYFPGRSTEVIDAWSGLRVLPSVKGSAFNRSRETMLSIDNDSTPHMVSIFGGKLTGYRATAERVMNLLRSALPPSQRLALTSELPLDPPTE